eukprot:1152701-Pelagomonas_calceolata.AAC.2
MTRRLFSSFSAEQLSELPKLTVSWPSALSIAGASTALGWSVTLFITEVQKGSVVNKVEALDTKLDRYAHDIKKKLDRYAHDIKKKVDALDTKLEAFRQEVSSSLKRLEQRNVAATASHSFPVPRGPQHV